MAESTRVNGKITICMVRESTPGPTREDTTENTSMTRSMDSEPTLILMEDLTRDSGRMVSKMEKEHLPHLKEKPKKVSGKKVKEFNGWMKPPIDIREK